MPNTWRVRITKGDKGPKDKTQVYFTSVLPDAKSPGVSIDQSVGHATQNDAVADIQKKLTVVFVAGDDIRYGGGSYATVVDAINAVNADRPHWV
jgi:hypothetical protein